MAEALSYPLPIFPLTNTFKFVQSFNNVYLNYIKDVSVISY